MVRGDRQESHQAALLQLPGGVQNPRRHRLVPHAEQQDVGVVIAQSPQGALQAPGHQSRDPRVRLNHQHEFVALRAQALQPFAERGGPPASPIDVVHAPLERALQGVARNSITGADSQPPHFQTCAA